MYFFQKFSYFSHLYCIPGNFFAFIFYFTNSLFSCIYNASNIYYTHTHTSHTYLEVLFILFSTRCLVNSNVPLFLSYTCFISLNRFNVSILYSEMAKIQYVQSLRVWSWHLFLLLTLTHVRSWVYNVRILEVLG